jgi:uroporphyrinogen decarboxylase
MVCADHAAWIGNADLKETLTDARKLADVLERAFRMYHYDMVLVFTDPYVEAQAMGCNVEFNPQPMLKQGKNDGSRTDRTAVVIEAARILNENVDVPVFASIKGPFTLASFLAGSREFLAMLLKDAAKANCYISSALDFQNDYLSRFLEVGVNIFIGDPMASASVISPELFKQFASLPLRRLINETRAAGAICGLHICGDTAPIMKELDDLGADLLSIEDITVPTRTVRMGGVATSTIHEGNREKIAGEIVRALNEPHLVLSTSCDVPMQTKEEHVHYMMETFGLHA